jgi:hypothetical protein
VDVVGVVIGVVGLALALWAEFRARRSERENELEAERRERAEVELNQSQQELHRLTLRLHELTVQLPDLTTEKLRSALDLVTDSGDPSEALRGWVGHTAARVGYAQITALSDRPDLLIEYAFGAHSAALLVLGHDEFDNPVLRGGVFNGTGHRFHVRERSDGRGSEVVTLDYVKPLWSDRSFFEMPVQPVYYRWRRSRFVEVGRGELWDPRDPWSVPESVLPLLNQQGLEEARQAEAARWSEQDGD